jgi:hypothetical protein
MINIREERATDVVARENLLDEAYGAVRFGASRGVAICTDHSQQQGSSDGKDEFAILV